MPGSGGFAELAGIVLQLYDLVHTSITDVGMPLSRGCTILVRDPSMAYPSFQKHKILRMGLRLQALPGRFELLIASHITRLGSQERLALVRGIGRMCDLRLGPDGSVDEPTCFCNHLVFPSAPARLQPSAFQDRCALRIITDKV